MSWIENRNFLQFKYFSRFSSQIKTLWQLKKPQKPQQKLWRDFCPFNTLQCVDVKIGMSYLEWEKEFLVKRLKWRSPLEYLLLKCFWTSNKKPQWSNKLLFIWQSFGSIHNFTILSSSQFKGKQRKNIKMNKSSWLKMAKIMMMKKAFFIIV